jgi:hypothetical protein
VQEQRLANRLDRMALPAGGLVSAGQLVGLGPLRDVSGVPVRARWRTYLTRAFGFVLAAFLLVTAIDVIADNTQDRPDAPITSGSATLTVNVQNRFTGRSKLRTTEALFVACRHTLTQQHSASGFTEATPGRVAFTVEPDFGQHSGRRFVGCLEDALFDRVSASVVSVAHNP